MGPWCAVMVGAAIVARRLVCVVGERCVHWSRGTGGG